MSVGEIHECTVRAEDAGARIDKFLGGLDFVVSRSAAARLLDFGYVRVNGSPVSKRHVLRAGERIAVEIPPPERGDLVPEAIPLDIRYEDDDLIILSKQAGLVVHPAHGNWTGTLVHALLAHAEELGTLAGEDRPGIVHRLDKDTTGLMMVAKSDEAQAALSEAIKIRSVDRRYITLVHGYVAPDSGLVDGPLARDQRDRTKMCVSAAPGSKQAVTTFRVLERFEAGAHDDGYSLLECKLYTGRTHQIRVHLASISHPCVGDPQYGHHNAKADHGLTRQFLHAYSLELDHPTTGAHLKVVDPLPEDLARVLEEIASDSRGRTEAGNDVLAQIEIARAARGVDTSA